jgi:hypothetical protein
VGKERWQTPFVRQTPSNSFTARRGIFTEALGKPMKKDDSKESETVLYPYQQSERERLKRSIRGGIITLKVDGSHPLAYGYGSLYHTLKNQCRPISVF